MSRFMSAVKASPLSVNVNYRRTAGPADLA